jgi:CubicO group peptidase (beta-lactamase class C family)
MKYTLILVLSFFLSYTCCGQPIDYAKINSLLFKAEATHSEAVIIFKDNKLVVEKYFGLGTLTKKIETMSCTKSIVGLAIACLLSDHLIENLDVPVCNFYPEWRQGAKKDITLRHLTNMTSGMQNNPNASIEIYPSRDFVQLALASELSSKPGQVWEYNNKAINLIAGVILKITGQRMDKYIAERLFKPLDIVDYNWQLDSVGNPHVMAGCQLMPNDFVKLGLLVCNNGLYNGKLIISKEHIAELFSPSKLNPGYGLLWWIDYEHINTIVDDEIIHTLIKANVDQVFIDKVIQLKGEYASRKAYFDKVVSIFGANPWEYINTTLGSNLQIRKRKYNGQMTYRADGYLGNYIIVCPSKNLVAIRMISHDSFTSDTDNFEDFEKMILDIVK